MFATYDYEKYPVVHVTFGETIDNESDFTDFLDEWERLYDTGDEFLLIFDTTLITNIQMTYVYKIVSFLSSIKKNKPHNLKKTTVKISFNVCTLLLAVFYKYHWHEKSGRFCWGLEFSFRSKTPDFPFPLKWVMCQVICEA